MKRDLVVSRNYVCRSCEVAVLVRSMPRMILRPFCPVCHQRMVFVSAATEMLAWKRARKPQDASPTRA